MPRSRQGKSGTSARSAFTLIELMLVLALLAIGAALVAPRLISFFRGRALNLEARRMLSVVHYAQSRAVTEGVPVMLWFNTKAGTYGQYVQSSYLENDDRSSTYQIESSLTMEAGTTEAAAVSESGDEKFGMPEGQPVIRFTPDGFFDYGSISRLVLRQGTEAALQLTPTTDRLSYEILPYTSP